MHKVPTTYSQVRVGDQLDNEIIISVEHTTFEGQELVALCFSGSLQWGPWQLASTPVSVYRVRVAA